MRRDLEIRKGFVVFLLFVVFGLNVLDQSRFHQQGIYFTLAFNAIRVPNLIDPNGRSQFLGYGLNCKKCDDPTANESVA